jgi:hypothetical protein
MDKPRVGRMSERKCEGAECESAESEGAECESAVRASYTGGRMLETGPETCHFLPLFEPAGAACRSPGSIGKSFPGGRSDMAFGLAGRSGDHVA